MTEVQTVHGPVDDGDLGIVLVHEHLADPRRSGGAARLSARAGETMEVVFTGDSVRWITTTHATRGIARIHIDGVDHGTVDTCTPATAFQVPVFTATGLGAGPHSLIITNTGTAHPDATATRIEIDAIAADGVVP